MMSVEKNRHFFPRNYIMSENTIAELTFLALFTLLPISFQEPLLSKNTYKGLRGTIPSSYVSSSGLHRAVYYHDQAVAIIDINNKNEIKNCDVVEVYESEEAAEVLGNLSKTSRPSEISFSQMTSLMYRCQMLDRIQTVHSEYQNRSKSVLERANVLRANVFNLFSGILPGTKWCGTGDIAKYYHDLGTDSESDRCCRTHDLCPVKIRAQSTRYNLTNYSIYSKSHCDCDNAFYNCLKSVNSPIASIMGKIYFNIIKVGCIEDFPENINTQFELTRRFSQAKLYY